MKQKTKITCLILVILAIVAVLAALLISKIRKQNINDNTLTINLGNRNVEQMIYALKAEFPDIHFDIKGYEGGSATSYLYERLIHGDASDIVYHSIQLDDATAEKYLLDLSAYDFVSNIDSSLLSTFSVDGHIYQIPGPVYLRCMVYNDTLFKEHGWEKPTNFDELVELCKQIRSETDDITPIAMSLGGAGYPFTTVTTLSQAGFLSTPAGADWETAYFAGNASLADGFAEGLEMTGRLIDAQAFNPQAYVGLWDAESLNIEFSKGKAAMYIIWGGPEYALNVMDNSEYEYKLLPFYGQENGKEFLGIATNSTFGISSRLGEKGNEKKLENALKVMEWLTSEEAQTALKSFVQTEDGKKVIGSSEIMSAKGAIDENASPLLQNLWNASVTGRKGFMLYSGYEDIMVEVGTIVQDAMLAGTSKGMAEKVVENGDKLHKESLASRESPALGTIAEDLNAEQTVQLVTNVLHDAGLGDFVLATHADLRGEYIANKWGVGGNLYAGEVTDINYNIINNYSSKPLDILTLTGSQVKDLLENGKTLTNPMHNDDIATWEYYWSGLEVKFSNNKIASIKLNNQELLDDNTYRVVFLPGDYPDELAKYATEQIDGINLLTVWKKYLAENSPIQAPEILRK